MNLGDFCFEVFEVFLKSTAICCITFGSRAGNLGRALLGLWLSAGEYQQYLEQKFTFSLMVSSSSCMVLNPHVTILILNLKKVC